MLFHRLQFSPHAEARGVAPATDTLNPAPFMPPFYWLFHVRDRMLCEIELG
jgi:hypothetical protein